MGDISKKLENKLMLIRNEKDFILGVMSWIKEEKTREKLLNIIEYGESIDDELSVSQIIAIAMELHEEEDDEKS